jgi:hypothetical protein
MFYVETTSRLAQGIKWLIFFLYTYHVRTLLWRRNLSWSVSSRFSLRSSEKPQTHQSICPEYVHNTSGYNCTKSNQFLWSRVSSVSIKSGYGLDDRAAGVRSPAGEKDFSSSLCVQTGYEAHPASCTMGTGGPFSGSKARPGRDADHSPPSMPRSWMSRSYTSSPLKRLHGV